MFFIYSSQVNGVRSRVRPATSHSTSSPGTYLLFRTLEYQAEEPTVPAEFFIRMMRLLM